MSYSISHITRIISAESTIVSDTIIEHLLTDSRRTYSPASSLFFATKGIRRDGHQFIPDLYKRGVRNFVISRPLLMADFPEANFLAVKDTIAALQQLAAYHRRQFNIPVIGITGSNGKTIVKEWLYQLLHPDYHIVRSPKSYNSQIGVPLSVWQMNKQHTLAIFEAGISQPGEMENLQKIIQPTIGLITNIGEAHSEGFANNEQKVTEKIKLFKEAAQVVFGYNNQLVLKSVQEWKNEKIPASDNEPFTLFGWGESEDAWLQITDLKKDTSSTSIIGFIGRQTQHIDIPFTDNASIENAVSCWCVLRILNVSQPVIESRMKNLQPVNMRLELKKGINNCSVINDSYSADLSSLNIALNFLDNQTGSAKKVVVLSDFLQSGLEENELYRKIGRTLQNHSLYKIIGIGERISNFLPSVLTDSSILQEYFLNTEVFIQHYRFSQFKDEAILIKGARVFEFEKIVHLLEQKVHQTVLEINLNAIAHNLKEFQKILQPSTRIMAMVKAFAYGSGGAEIASILQYHQVDYLGVAYADEGVELRKAGIRLPVMVMNPEENAFNSIIENNLEPELYSFEILLSFDKFLQKEGLQLYPIHIEIDTGMNRLGFSIKDLDRLAAVLQTTSSFKVQSVFSHLAASEEAGQDNFTIQQFDLFTNSAKKLQEKIGYHFICHISNSAAAIRHPQLQMDMIRLGIGLYGVDNSGASALNLQTVATLKSTISQINYLKKGDSVSYNRKGIVDKDSIIATIRIGYADGFPRRLGNGVGKVWINGKLSPVIGTVCMDMFMLDVTNNPGVQVGDDVIIFGSQLPVQTLAQWASTIPYEIMTGVSQRVKRVYFEE